MCIFQLVKVVQIPTSSFGKPDIPLHILHTSLHGRVKGKEKTVSESVGEEVIVRQSIIDFEAPHHFMRVSGWSQGSSEELSCG